MNTAAALALPAAICVPPPPPHCRHCHRRLPAEPARPWLDASLPLEARVETLLGAMTPQQKAAQLQTDPGGALPELGVPPFAWQVRLDNAGPTALLHCCCHR